MKDQDGIKILARNKRAWHEYEILEQFEAGIALMGSEIKSLRAGGISFGEGFVEYRGGELWLLNVHISPYKQASLWGHEPLRPRKLLMHRKEIVRLYSKMREKSWTLVPLQIYLKNGRVKVEIALARGKKLYDKREALAKKDADRQIKRALKDY
jgi:SsrA-binding protein